MFWENNQAEIYVDPHTYLGLKSQIGVLNEKTVPLSSRH